MRRKMGWVLLIATVGVGFFACAADAAVVIYEMSVAPDAEAVPMTKYGTGFGQGGGGLLGDGTARFVDTGNFGNEGFVLQGFASGWTADTRIAILANTGPGNDARSIGIRQASGNGRALGFLTGSGDGFQL